MPVRARPVLICCERFLANDDGALTARTVCNVTAGQERVRYGVAVGGTVTPAGECQWRRGVKLDHFVQIMCWATSAHIDGAALEMDHMYNAIAKEAGSAHQTVANVLARTSLGVASLVLDCSSNPKRRNRVIPPPWTTPNRIMSNMPVRSCLVLWCYDRCLFSFRSVRWVQTTSTLFYSYTYNRVKD